MTSRMVLAFMPELGAVAAPRAAKLAGLAPLRLAMYRAPRTMLRPPLIWRLPRALPES